MFGSAAYLLALAAVAQASPASAVPSVEEIRTTARTMLESMCGQQCDVIDVKLKNKRATPAGAPMPGFDEEPAVRWVPGEIDLVILFDAKLTAAYRKFVADRVKQRIGELGLPVLVNERVTAFPPPPELPREEPQPAPVQPQQPQPQPVIIQPPPQAAPPPQPAPDLKDALLLRLIEALPILLIFGLLAWLVLRVLKKMEDLGARVPAQNAEAADSPSMTLTPEIIEESRMPERIATSLPPPNPERLSSDLRTHRGSTRRIFRRLLVRGEHDTVARAVALLGDFVVKDLSHDPALRQSLGAAGQRTAEILRAPMTDEDSEDVLRSVQAELVADRVAHRADDVRKEFEVLLGWGPEAFATIMRRLDERLSLLLLRHAPTHLSESFLAGLAPNVRAEIVRKLLAEPHAEPEEIELLAEAIEAQKNAAIVGGYEADHIVDLLDSLPAGEQEAVVTDLETTRPDFVRRNLGQLPVESALLRVPEQALAAAWAAVSFEDWIAYLRVAPQAIKERAIAACPARLRDGLVEELGLRVAPDPDRATEARRRIVRAALTHAPRTSNGAALGLTVVEKREVAAPKGAAREREKS